MNFGEMKRKCESKGLGFTRFSREAVEGLLERARRALARPLANLVPPPPFVEKRAVERFYAAFGAAYFPFCVQVNTSCLEMYLLSFHHKEIRRTNYEAYNK